MNENQIIPDLGEFVTEGVMLAVPLNFPGQTAPPAAGETAITCLELDPAGAIYCGTSGRRAHVLAAMIHGDSGVVLDMGVIPGATRVDAVVVRDERVCAIASGPDGCAMWSWPRMICTFLIQEWAINRRAPEKVCDLFSGGRVADAAVLPGKQVIYGITDPGGELFRLDIASSDTTVLAKVDEENCFSRRIVLDRSGCIWGTRGAARIWRCEPAAGKIDEVARIPAAAGRSQHTQASAWAVDTLTGALYGGTTPDGFFFRIDTETTEVVPLGKPTRLDEINCLTIGNDGRVFGACGLAEDVGHLFCYDPQRGALRDLGVGVSTLTARQYGYHFRCMATGRDGEIYLGQHERVNHLWIYFPPTPRHRAADTEPTRSRPT